jgi:predicted RNase H-like nuclease (RuvC/YqgF family)
MDTLDFYFKLNEDSRKKICVLEKEIQSLKEETEYLKLHNKNLNLKIKEKDKLITKLFSFIGFLTKELKKLKIKICKKDNNTKFLKENIRVLRIINQIGTRREDFQKRNF